MKISWIAALALIFLFVPTVGAISTPDVTFIPSQISVNSSFIIIADPHASAGESLSVKWIVYGVEYGYWSINFVGNKYVCYFSNTDTPNICGPNMFPAPSYGVPYETQIIAVTPSQNESTFVNVSIGGIPIRSEISITGNNIYIKAWAGNPITGTISYKVYDSAGLNMVKSGTMIKNDLIFGYTTNITLSNGEYYIAFTANSASDFGGGVARVVVGGGGGGTGSPDVKADSIAYSPVINPNQEFRIETFKITNLGTDNLTGMSISVPQQISNYLTITPKKTFLEPNESTYMTVTLHNIQSSANISTFATLLSGSTEIKQIPVELRISVIGGINPESCVGKTDMTLCLGGICCGQICKTEGAQCCSSSNCPSGKECSDYKCTGTVPQNECEGLSDMASCTGGRCCSGSCITGGECCSSSDCSIGETCSYSNICEAQPANECDGKSEGASCSTGYCCNGECQKCCTNVDCTGAGETCSADGTCTVGGNGGEGGIDIMTIALIGGGVAVAAVVGFFLFKKFVKKKGKEGDEEFEEGGDEKEEDEFSDEDFY